MSAVFSNLVSYKLSCDAFIFLHQRKAFFRNLKKQLTVLKISNKTVNGCLSKNIAIIIIGKSIISPAFEFIKSLHVKIIMRIFNGFLIPTDNEPILT